MIRRDESGGSDPMKLGRTVAKCLEKKRLPYRKCIASADQHLAVWLHDLLPARLNAKILRDYYIKK